MSDGTRTRDRLDHNQELYQLSYAHRAGASVRVGAPTRLSGVLHLAPIASAPVTDVAPRRRADAQRSVTAILAAARDVLAADPAAEVQAIVERSGLNRSTVYRHFPHRTALIAAVYGEYLDAVTACLQTLDPEAADARAELRRVTVAVLRIADRWRPFRYAPTFGVDVADRRDRVHPPLAAMMERGLRDGVLRQDMTVDELVLGWGVSLPSASLRVAEGSWTIDDAADFMLVLIAPR